MKFPSMFAVLAFVLFSFSTPTITHAQSSACRDCHGQGTPGIVADWEASKHGARGVDCAVCHGERPQFGRDVALAKIPTPETCALCHADRVAQFKSGKHAAAWAAMKAMPTTHWLPMALSRGHEGLRRLPQDRD